MGVPKKTLLLFLLIVCEVLLITYCKKIFGPLITPILLLLISVAIGVFPILFFKETKFVQRGVKLKTADRNTFYFVLLFLAIALLTFFIPRGGIHGIINAFMIDPKNSDVIPTIQVLCKRFINGEPVYQYVDNFGYHIAPSYLPMVWLPYVVAELLHIDYRYVMWFLWLGIMVLLIIAGIRKNNPVMNLLCVLLIGFYIFSIIDKEPSALGWTFELANASFYVLLLIGLLSNDLLVKAVVIAGCLLSRYSIVLFMPLIYLIEWNKNGKKSAAVLLLYTIVFLSVVLLPLLHNHWKEVYDGYKYYAVSGVGEWKHVDDHGVPVHIANGNGMAAWVYMFKHGSVEEKFAFAQKLHLFFVSLTVIVLGIFYWLKKKNVDSRWYTIGGIKIYLAVFYGFIQVPYTYLFLLPLLYSVAMFVMLNNNVERVQQQNLITT